MAIYNHLIAIVKIGLDCMKLGDVGGGNNAEFNQTTYGVPGLLEFGKQVCRHRGIERRTAHSTTAQTLGQTYTPSAKLTGLE